MYNFVQFNQYSVSVFHEWNWVFVMTGLSYLDDLKKSGNFKFLLDTQYFHEFGRYPPFQTSKKSPVKSWLIPDMKYHFSNFFQAKFFLAKLKSYIILKVFKVKVLSIFRFDDFWPCSTPSGGFTKKLVAEFLILCSWSHQFWSWYLKTCCFVLGKAI